MIIFLESLEGRVIWITGASSGIGKALAIRLAKAKVRVVLSARSVENLNEVKQKCIGESSDYFICICLASERGLTFSFSYYYDNHHPSLLSFIFIIVNTITIVIFSMIFVIVITTRIIFLVFILNF